MGLQNNPSAGPRCMARCEIFTHLGALPVMVPKSTRCVIMCNLDYDVFPVDVNMNRNAVRVGVVSPKQKHYQKLIPDGRSKEFHVGIVVHMRTLFLPRKPKRDSCISCNLCDYGLTTKDAFAPLRKIRTADPL